MKIKKYYNVHGLITFSIEGESDQIKYLCEQCEYFLSKDPVDQENIRICIGPFQSIVDEHRECQIINRKFYVSENVVFAEDIYKTARWKVQVENLDSEQTTFYFDGNSWTKYILHKSFVEVILRYKLNQKGYFMVHSSAVSIDGKGVVFAASPEAGKTSTMLNYLEVGQAFMADDFSLLGKGIVYAYPTPITLHQHNLKRHPFLSNALSGKEKREIFWRTLILKMTFGMGDISYKVDIWNKLKGVAVERQCTLGQIVLFTKYNGGKVTAKQIDKHSFIEKLLIINQYETTQFNAYLKAYYYQNLHDPKNEFWTKMKTNFEENLPEQSYTEIFIPQKYTKQEFEELNRILIAMMK